MKVLVTGSNGQLGYDVIRVLKEKNIEHLGIDIKELDITVEEDVKVFVKNYNPTHIIHCAAYTQVDKAEDNKDLCYNINVLGTRYLVDSAKEINSEFMYISTDYVFDGNGEAPFKPNDVPNPVNYYGLTKYQGEQEVINKIKDYYILRISWVFGINGHNFIKTMLKLSETRNELSVVSDQMGSPTYTYDLSYMIWDLIKNKKYGINHVTNDKFCSWNDFAKEIFLQSNKNVTVNKILTRDYPTRALRPLNSRMEGIKMRDWKDALRHYLNELDKW